VAVRVLASILFASLLLAAAPALARAKPPTPDLIDRAEQSGQLDRSRADLYRTYAIAAPERLPAAFRSTAPWEGTLTLLQVRRDLPRLRESARKEIQALLAPQPSGEWCSNVSGTQSGAQNTTHFHVTYNSVGGGLTAADYAASLERSWQKEVDTFGWAAPPVLTSNPPAGNRYHVRIDDLGSGLYGFVDAVGAHAGLVGNNPATSWDEGDAYASCMVLNNDYTGFPSTPQASLDSTTAHEFNHSIQFGYGGLSGANLPDNVFIEGGATWMEDEVHDAANDNYNYLWPVFRDSMGDYDNSPYPYWVTFRGLTERYGTGSAGGGEQVMQDFWELTSKNASSNLDAITSALAARSTTLADAFHAYAIAVKFNKACGGGYVYPYCFEEGPGYVAKKGATTVNATVASVGGSASSSVEDNYALAWVALPSSTSPYNVTLTNTTAGQLRGTVACDTGTGLQLSPLPNIATAGQTTSTLVGFNPAGCTARVLVVTNQAKTAANPSSSSLRSFSVSTAAAPPDTRTLSVSKTGSGSGTVTSSPAGINCGGDCSQSYATGTEVTLTATPAAGSSFTGWSGGGCSGTGTCVVTLSANQSVSAGFDLIPDNTPPETNITGGPTGDTTDSTPTFTFTSSEPGSSFSCQIDSDTPVDCSSPYTTAVLSEGPHTFSVAATDTADNTDLSPATRDFTVVAGPPPDEDPPETTITDGPSGDTTDTTPTFAFGSDEANSTFVCQIDQALPAPCDSPHTTEPLGTGDHVFSVYARDPAGNDDLTPATRAFTVVSSSPAQTSPTPTTPTQTTLIAEPDFVAPAIAAFRLSRTVFRAASSGPAIASLVGTRISLTLSEQATVTFRVARLAAGRRVGGRCVAPTARNRSRPRCERSILLRGRIVRELASGTSRLRYRGRLRNKALAPGRYRLLVRARDAAGNLSSRRRAAFTIVR
jgi:Divergent InlB B-repeat domain